MLSHSLPLFAFICLLILILHLPFLNPQNICYSISSSLTSTVCSGHGVCKGLNNCYCIDSVTNNTLYSDGNSELTQGSYLTSSNGLYRLYLNMDGSLIYRTVSSNTLIKSLFTPTGNPSGPFVLKMQSSGIAELFDGSNNKIFSAGTAAGLAPYRFIVQSDRNIVIYDSLGAAPWHASTYIAGNSNEYLYGGSDCSTPRCNGILATETTTVCSGHGTCSSPNNCTCNKGRIGAFCELQACGGIAAIDATNVCSGRGTCLVGDICSCNNNDDWGGDYCQFPKCDGILANETQLRNNGRMIDSFSNRICDKINMELLQTN
ncbi:hypothetical protein ABK040_004023 [Willaertia magna]